MKSATHYHPEHSNVGTETAPIPHDYTLLLMCQVHLRIQQKVVDHMNHQVLVVRKSKEESDSEESLSASKNCTF